MKKTIWTIINFLLIVFILTACGGKSEKKNNITDLTSEDTEETTTKLNINVKNITSEELLNYPETDGKFFLTDESEQGLSIISYEGSDSVVVIPKEIDGKRVISIDQYAFSDNVSAVFIPETMINVGECAFCECENLRLIVFAEGTKKIGNFAFLNCKKLENISLPQSLEEVGKNAFQGLKVKKIELYDKLTELNEFTFSEVNNMTIILGDNIQSIDSSTFSDSENITVIVKKGTTSFNSVEAYNNEAGNRGDKSLPQLTVQEK